MDLSKIRAGLENQRVQLEDHILYSLEGQSYVPPEEVLRLERIAHRIFTSWSHEHHIDDPDIGVLPYDRKLSGQRIDVYKSNSSAVTNLLPRIAYKAVMGSIFRRQFDSREAYENFVGEFNAAPAYPDKDTPVAEALSRDYLRLGKSVVGIAFHPDRKLSDLPRIAAGVNLALPGTKHMRDINVVLNYNMSRETYRSKAVVQRIGRVANSIWVIPLTENMYKHAELANQDGGEEITEEDVLAIMKYVNVGAVRGMLRDMREAGQFTMINPNGQRPAHLSKNGKLVRIEIPSAYQEAANLVALHDAALPLATVGDKISIGNIIPIEKAPKSMTRQEKDAHNAKIADELMELTTDEVRNLVGEHVEVVYSRLLEKAA